MPSSLRIALDEGRKRLDVRAEELRVATEPVHLMAGSSEGGDRQAS